MDLTVTALHIPCPECGTKHDFKPGAVYARRCLGCGRWFVAAEWRESFLRTAAALRNNPPLDPDIDTEARSR
jgi:hypothetical protein